MTTAPDPITFTRWGDPITIEARPLAERHITELMRTPASKLTWYTRTLRNAIRGARRQGVEYHVTRTATQAHIVKTWNPADATSVSLDYTITADGTVYQWHTVDTDDRRYRVRHPSSAR